MTEIEAAMREGTIEDRLISIDEALQAVPGVDVDAETAARVCHGVPLPSSRVVRWLGTFRAGELVRVRNQGETIALATAPADHSDLAGRGARGVFKIDRVLRDAIVQVSGGPGLSSGPARSR
jgi:tRNA U55 pseudouridine synthase TruB